MIVTPTSLAAWQTCRLQHALRRTASVGYKQTMNQRMGDCAHDSLEQFYNTEPSARSHDQLMFNAGMRWGEMLKEAEEAGEKVDLTQWGRYMDKTKRCLDHHWTEFGADLLVGGGRSEETFSLELAPDVALQARLDYRQGHNVYELKTSATRQDPDKYIYFAPQLRYQALLVQRECGDHVMHLTTLWPTGADRISMSYTPEILDETQATALRLAREIQAGGITAHEGLHCTWCSFNALCKARLSGATNAASLALKAGA